MEERTIPRTKEEAKKLLISIISSEKWEIFKIGDLFRITLPVQGIPEPLDIALLFSDAGGVRIQCVYFSNVSNELVRILERHLGYLNAQLLIKYEEMYKPFKIGVSEVTNLFHLDAYVDVDYRFSSEMDFSFDVLTAIHSQELLFKSYCELLIQKKEEILAEWQNKNSYNSISNTYNSSVSNTDSSGCYIATAIYGSYDCPEVWTLRRYRDYDLSATWYGRMFVKLYYLISPKLVKYLGHTKWFKTFWKAKLDRFISVLHERGFESTPYDDKKW